MKQFNSNSFTPTVYQQYPTPSVQTTARWFLGSGPKGPMSCRTQGGISIRPFVRPSFRPPPVGHQGLKFALPALNLALQASNQPSRLQISPPPASNLTYRPQICPPDLQLGLQASNQPSVAQICPPNLKSTLKASILPSSLQICLLWPESVIYCQKCASSGRMEIPPCVLQDIGPLGPLPCSHSTSSLDHSQQGIGYR